MPRYAGMANYQTSSVKLHSTLTPALFDSSVKLAGEHIASAKAELGAAMVALEPGTVTELAEYTLAKASPSSGAMVSPTRSRGPIGTC
jgi:hypothetical protein